MKSIGYKISVAVKADRKKYENKVNTRADIFVKNEIILHCQLLTSSKSLTSAYKPLWLWWENQPLVAFQYQGRVILVTNNGLLWKNETSYERMTFLAIKRMLWIILSVTFRSVCVDQEDSWRWGGIRHQCFKAAVSYWYVNVQSACANKSEDDCAQFKAASPQNNIAYLLQPWGRTCLLHLQLSHRKNNLIIQNIQKPKCFKLSRLFSALKRNNWIILKCPYKYMPETSSDM